MNTTLMPVKFKLIAILQFVLVMAYGQSSVRSLEFNSKPDFKDAEPEILKNANYILTSPNDKSNNDRTVALQNIIKWMSGTPDYKFTIDESVSNLMQKDPDILGVFMASMTKYVLENPGQASDNQAVKLQSFTILLDYCGAPANKMKKTKELQKAIAAMKEGKLKEYLKIK